MFLLVAALGCATADPNPGSGSGSSTLGPSSSATTITIHEEYWDGIADCWKVRDLERPAADWPDDCSGHIDTAPRWAYDLFSDADGNCVRLAVHCPQTDAFIADCSAVADCCDDAKLGEGTCF